MKTQNVTFGEALEMLAKQAGVPLQERSQQQSPEKEDERDRFYKINELALEFWRQQLAAHPEARAYCDARSLTTEVLKKWEIGFAPADGQALAREFARHNVDLLEAAKLFLVEDDASGKSRDKFRNRLMFPIRDDRGRLVAFGGRQITEIGPKYINSSDTPLYKKSKVLYGLWQSRTAMSKSKQGVLCEGYMDVIACHRGGIENAVASLGTALSTEQAELLKRKCQLVTILYDGDTAGKKATHRALEILDEVKLEAKIVSIPGAQDPDDILKTQGAAALMECVQKANSPAQFRLRSLQEEFGIENDQFWHSAVELLAGVPNAVERSSLIEQLALKHPNLRDVSVARNALMTDVRAAMRTRGRAEKAPPTAQPRTRAKLLLPGYERLLFVAFFADIRRAIIHEHFLLHPETLSVRCRQLAQSLVEPFGTTAPEGPPTHWIHRIEPTALDSLLELSEGEIGEISPEAVLSALETLRKKEEKVEIQRERLSGSASFEELAERIRNLKTTQE